MPAYDAEGNQIGMFGGMTSSPGTGVQPSAPATTNAYQAPQGSVAELANAVPTDMAAHNAPVQSVAYTQAEKDAIMGSGMAQAGNYNIGQYDPYTGQVTGNNLDPFGQDGGNPYGWQYPFGLPERQSVSMMDPYEQSPWAKMMQRTLAEEYGQARAGIGQQARTGMQGGMNTLARQGGLTGGARVALANKATQQRVKGLGDLAGAHAVNLSKLGTQDIDRQLEQRNLESQRQYGADQWDFLQKKSAFDNEQYAKALEQYGAAGGVDPWQALSPLNPFPYISQGLAGLGQGFGNVLYDR